MTILRVALFFLSSVTAQAQTQMPAPTPTPAPVTNTCAYIEPDDATKLLGQEVNATTAPSRGALLSCGYTSPSGNALTVSIADYGIPSVAKQFFEKTWELTKSATVEDALGASGFALISTDPTPRVTITAQKDMQIVTIEASGAAVGTAQTLPALRAMIIKLLAKVPLTAPPAPAPTAPPL
jgi:hypothetical protein